MSGDARPEWQKRAEATDARDIVWWRLKPSGYVHAWPDYDGVCASDVALCGLDHGTVTDSFPMGAHTCHACLTAAEARA